MHFADDATYPSVDSAWRGLVGEIVAKGDIVAAISDPLSVGSKFGTKPRRTREVVAARILIENPRDRLVLSGLRQFRLDYSIATVIWALSASEAVSPLTFYNPAGRDFSDDGHTVRSAIGRRVFGMNGICQFRAAIENLRVDPLSRRSMIQVYLPSDLLQRTRDVSCTGSIHFLVRGGRLHAIVQMRSQSALMVLPYDLFLLTMVHEYASICSGLELGAYWHISNSAHIYEDELPNAESLLAEELASPEAMPYMPSSTADEIELLITAEKHVRESLANGMDPAPRLRDFELSAYWKDLLQAAAADWRLRSGQTWANSGASLLPGCYQQCLRQSHKSRLDK